MTIHVYQTPQLLASAAADRIASYIAGTDRPVTLGLAGGGTPAATYRELTNRDVEWAKTTMWLGDERWVPHDHSDSNTRMIRETLADSVVARCLAPNTAFGDPAAAAAAYSESLRAVFHDGRPDLILLGIGDDGHTASLFPGTAALEATAGIYLANWIPSKNVWRLTASMPLLWGAREIVFLVQGAAKAEVLAAIVDEGRPYPAQRVAAGAGNVHWMVDAAAAALLVNHP